MAHQCGNCGSANGNIFFPNIPWFTHWHCHDCGSNKAVTENEIEQELERRSESYPGDADDEVDVP